MKMFKLLTSSDFLRHNAILIFGAVAAGFLNYLFYPVIGRLLDPVSFGEVQVIFSLFLQLTIFLGVLNTVTVFIVANYKNVRQRNTIILELEKIAACIAVGLLVLTIIFGQWIKEFFKFDSAVPFFMLSVLIIISVLLTFRVAFLRGRKKFKTSVIANFLSPLGRILFAAPLVILGMGANGALIGVVAGHVIALVYTIVKASQAGLKRPSELRVLSRPKLKTIWPELKYSLLVLFGSLAVMLQLTFDALVVKHLFDPQTAGLYAGLVTVSRTIFFFAAPIVMALLPSVKLDAEHKANIALLKKSILLFLAISLPLLIVMVAFPLQIINILMGPQYIEVANLLPLLALTTFVTSLLNVVVSYFLALKRYISGMLAIIGFAVTFGLMFFRHGSLQAIVESLFVGSMVSICLIAIWLARERLTSRGSHDEATTPIHRGSSSQ